MAIDIDAVERRLDGGESLRNIAASLGVTFQTLQYHRKKHGKAALRPAIAAGKQHHAWRGGSFLDRYGYRMLLAPGSGSCNKYRAEHVLVVEKDMGRSIRRGEVVHHINGDKLDNRRENLLLCSRKRHKKLHAELERIAYALIAEGAIVFDGASYRRR